MKSLLLILAGLSLVQLSLTQVLNGGACNQNIPTVKNFDASRYLGRWYENQKYPFIFELGGKCIYAEYGLMENKDLSIYNFNINTLTGKPNDIKGSAKIVGNAKLKVRFSSMPAFIGAADYWILDTDYDNYAVVYSCTDIGGLVNGKVVWILTREREPQPQYIERARSVIKENGLSLGPLYKNRSEWL
ncbi:apolipoprotein D-like [Lucilia sericata]|uniref:apolipoprotein D-like n=1 Tax=Lucilia sericata TaxID=13632 RepID=UPI0018A83EBE|nr:apolipoprotein D-like [Lucilia sericata]